MPLQKINITTEKKTEKKKTTAYGGAAKAAVSSPASHSAKIIAGTDVMTCPYCGQAMRR